MGPVFVLAILLAVAAPISGQLPPVGPATSCTASLVTSFMPCVNFITNSTGNGGSPTAECCKSLASLVNASTGCACLILTGNVPIGLPINRTLAVTLPRACNSVSVPLQCRDTSAQIPAPGPVAFGPSMPPLSPTASTESPVQPEPPASPVEPTARPPASQGQRPMVVPSSAWRSGHVSMLPAIAIGVGIMLV